MQFRMFFSGQLLTVLYHKLIDIILIRLLSIDLGQTNNLVDYRLHRYCLKALKVAFDNAVRLTLLPSRSEGSLSNSFPRIFNKIEAGIDVEMIF
ncbi:hypothetical protein AVEN_239978-1 [Araneus ventricosus]|uniref:Uncharacterized protein n=1 Tax=Araneus ventricosus TaxID=182803 RepID=A0A4Y2WUY9_ARAVE|nr:hypothetical protein AVEN_239978-1 [Araneus ventricosus]